MEPTNRFAFLMDQLAAERAPKKTAAPKNAAKPKVEPGPKKSAPKPKPEPPKSGACSVLFAQGGRILDVRIEVTPWEPKREKGDNFGLVETPAGWISVRLQA